MFELIDQELAARIAKNVSVDKILGSSLVDLLKLSPLNPAARAKVMAAVGQMPPLEMDTWDKIKEWVEKTHKPPAPPSKPARRESFGVPMAFTEHKRGTCRYSATLNGSDNYNFTLDMIVEMIADEELKSVEDLAEFIRGFSEENSLDCEPNMETDGDSYSYDDYDPGDSDGRECCMDEGQHTTEERLARYLRTHLPVESQRRLGMIP
jgi:hypothetical protein